MQDVIGELRLYVNGWLNYFGISHTYKVVLELEEWLRRRVRLYYWKQWKQARTRRRSLIKLGADPAEVKLASRSRKGYWRMSSNRILQQALTNHWLEEHGAPNIVTRRDNRGESGEFYFEIITGNLERGPVGM